MTDPGPTRPGAAPAIPAGKRVVVFDGVCNFCNSSVGFIIHRDRKAKFLFAPLQSEVAGQLLAGAGAPNPLPDSMAVVMNGRAYFRSAAAIRIAAGLRFPWPLLAVFWVIPWFIRDCVYDFIARRRYRWFGKREACMVPSPDVAARFLA